MSVDEILAALEHNDGVFPRDALKLAVANSEAIIPKLLREVQYSIDNVDEIYADEIYMRHIYALYLLAQFREVRAYPLIVELFSMSSDVVQHVTGDIITEDLGRILASTFDGDVRPLENMVEDENINKYVRSAALQAFVILWGQGALTREQVIQYFRCLFQEKLAGEVSSIWGSLVANSLNLSPNELEEDIEKVFDKGLVEPFYVGRGDVENSLGLSDEDARRAYRRDRRSGLIDDTISEMQWWASFQPQSERRLSSVGSTSNSGKRKEEGVRKIGRNAPCPCGSGKKFKKCCLNA